MALAPSIESAIHHHLARAGACSLDELTALLPGYCWAQVFAALDRLTREGTGALTPPAPLPPSSRSPLIELPWSAKVTPTARAGRGLTWGCCTRRRYARTGTSFTRWITPGTPPQTRRSCRIGPQKDPLNDAGTPFISL